ncbi:MAG: CvpA family protein [Chitinophagaceae bacterium]|nr:MAG: CvpA family protein [Chitinophagaceae bacterium]
MMIDGILIVLLILAVVKGYQRGFIVGIFSFIAVIVGLAAAMKLSAVTASWLGESTSVSKQWLPFLAFALVFLAVVLLIRLGANLLQKTAELGMLGWINRLAGIVLYALLYVTVFSVILFYATGIGFIKPETAGNSVTYGYISPIGPWFINALGVILPFFRDMFAQLSGFFDNVAVKAGSA